MNYSLKARCQGCAALESGTEFTCLFGLPLHCEVGEKGEQIQPSPYEVKCYKPKTKAEVKMAKLLMSKKTQESNA